MRALGRYSVELIGGGGRETAFTPVDATPVSPRSRPMSIRGRGLTARRQVAARVRRPRAADVTSSIHGPQRAPRVLRVHPPLVGHVAVGARRSHRERTPSRRRGLGCRGTEPSISWCRCSSSGRYPADAVGLLTADPPRKTALACARYRGGTMRQASSCTARTSALLEALPPHLGFSPYQLRVSPFVRP